MKFFTRYMPWQIPVLIALLLAGCGKSISSQSASNISMQQRSAPHRAGSPSSSSRRSLAIPILGFPGMIVTAHFCQKVQGEAGGCPKMKAGVL